MKNYFYLLIITSSALFAEAQENFYISVKNRSVIASDSILPFWYTANQFGKIREIGTFINLTDLDLGQPYRKNGLPISYTLGLNALGAFGESSYYQLNQIFAGVSWNGWELKAGMYHDSTRYAGLSTTNGNLARSQNTRPYPKILFGTLNYKPVPFLQNRLSYKAEYTEGILNDKRFVANARLHHKSFYLKTQLTATWEIYAGLEHFVMWGGTSSDEVIGELPSGIKDYVRYIFGTSGDESFPETDQRNVAGNQLGTYQFLVLKKFPEMKLSFYLSHPFEELSGLKGRNWPDNLLGLHFDLKDKEKVITDVVYEYTNTRQQSIRGTGDDPDPGNYFRHGIYRSSFTYHQKIMGSPLFFPVIFEEGIARGIGSNRFYAHHLGVKGVWWNSIHWDGLITYIHHFGLYTASYEPSHKQLSGILNLLYSKSEFPVELGLSIAADTGNTIPQRSGVQFLISKTF